MFDDIFDFNGDGIADTFEQIGGFILLDELINGDNNTNNIQNTSYSSDWSEEDDEDDDWLDEDDEEDDDL